MEKLTVAELRALLQERNLPDNGSRAVLLQRLRNSVAANQAVDEEDLDDGVFLMPKPAAPAAPQPPPRRRNSASQKRKPTHPGAAPVRLTKHTVEELADRQNMYAALMDREDESSSEEERPSYAQVVAKAAAAARARPAPQQQAYRPQSSPQKKADAYWVPLDDDLGLDRLFEDERKDASGSHVERELDRITRQIEKKKTGLASAPKFTTPYFKRNRGEQCQRELQTALEHVHERYANACSRLMEMERIVNELREERDTLFGNKASEMTIDQLMPLIKMHTDALHLLEAVMTRRLDEEREQLRDHFFCKLCYEEEANVLFFPCSHYVCCANCATGLKRCPVCRKVITHKKQVLTN